MLTVNKKEIDMTFLDELEIVEEIMDFRFCDWIIINDEYCHYLLYCLKLLFYFLKLQPALFT